MGRVSDEDTVTPAKPPGRRAHRGQPRRLWWPGRSGRGHPATEPTLPRLASIAEDWQARRGTLPIGRLRVRVPPSAHLRARPGHGLLRLWAAAAWLIWRCLLYRHTAKVIARPIRMNASAGACVPIAATAITNKTVRQPVRYHLTPLPTMRRLWALRRSCSHCR